MLPGSVRPLKLHSQRPRLQLPRLASFPLAMTCQPQSLPLLSHQLQFAPHQLPFLPHQLPFAPPQLDSPPRRSQPPTQRAQRPHPLLH